MFLPHRQSSGSATVVGEPQSRAHLLLSSDHTHSMWLHTLPQSSQNRTAGSPPCWILLLHGQMTLQWFTTSATSRTFGVWLFLCTVEPPLTDILYSTSLYMYKTKCCSPDWICIMHNTLQPSEMQTPHYSIKRTDFVIPLVPGLYKVHADAGRPLAQDCSALLIDSPTGQYSSSLWLSFLAIV